MPVRRHWLTACGETAHNAAVEVEPPNLSITSESGWISMPVL